MAQTITFLDSNKVRISGLGNYNIRKRNFGGVGQRWSDYDQPGNAYFNIGLDGDIYDALVEDGWDAWESSYTDKRTGETKPTYGIQCRIDRDDRGKSIIWQVDKLANGKRRKKLISVDDLETLALLDGYKFEDVEIISRGWVHKRGAYAGKKMMYLESMIYTLQAPEYSDKWGDLFDGSDEYGYEETDNEDGVEERPF